MINEYLSITELAKLRKVTSETLRYYDRIGLLKPDYTDPNNGYRYYSIRKSERLGVIRELRDLGMSIEEILNYFDDCNLRKSIEILSKQYFKMQQEIEADLVLSGKIAKKLTFLGELLSFRDLNQPFIKKYSERYLLSLNRPAGGEKEHLYALSELETMLNEISPILATDRLGVYTDEKILEPSDDYVPSVPMLFLKKEENNFDNLKENIQIVPAGYYLCIAYENGRLERYDSCFEKIKEYMKDNNLQVNGKIFQRYIIDVTMTSKRNETLMELQVPVRLEN